jgi:hypothetical protein
MGSFMASIVRRDDIEMRHLRQIIASFVLTLPLMGCANPAGDKLAASTSSHMAGPPSAKQVIDWTLSAMDIELNADTSCAGVGTELSDETVGDYLSGFLAEFTEANAGNRLEATCKDGSKEESVRATWNCRFVVRRQDGEDEWGWGVSFEVGKQDGELRRESLRCIGSG